MYNPQPEDNQYHDRPLERCTHLQMHILHAPPNAMICKVAGIDKHTSNVIGNLLVIKHVWKNRHQPVDYCIDDFEAVNNILKWQHLSSKQPVPNIDVFTEVSANLSSKLKKNSIHMS